MAVYPKQLQLFATDTGFRAGLGDDPLLPAIALTTSVNVLLNVLHKGDRNITSVHDGERIEERFRPFDTSFGDVQVTLDAVPHTFNEVIGRMRDAWDTYRAVSNNSIGLATSTQN